MDTYAQTLNFVIPIFICLILIEVLAAKKMGIRINRTSDMISSISSGITNVVKEVLGLTVAVLSYGWLIDKLAIIELQASWLVYLVAFIGMDFAGYWRHRIRHEFNLLWNGHISHHTSEEFNLSCGLRLPFVRIISFLNFFLIPAAIFGIPKEVIALLLPLHFVLQFWYHTRLINKMGWFEYVLVTPSHHRIHHAMNPEYLNKNYGNVFIFWDKWFGTFQKELEEVQIVYGSIRPVKTWNPILINFKHLWLLIQDAWQTKNYWDKLRIWFMPTGWRPGDVINHHPVAEVNDVLHFKKYDSHPSKGLLAWSWIQLTITIMLMILLFNCLSLVGIPGVFLYGAFLFVNIFSYTALLDKSSYAFLAEILRMTMGLTILGWYDGWLGVEMLLPGITPLMLLYLIASLIGTGYFYFTEIRREQVAKLDTKS